MQHRRCGGTPPPLLSRHRLFNIATASIHLKIVQVLGKGFLDHQNREEGEAHADAADDQRAPDAAVQPFGEGGEAQRDRDDRTTNEVRDRRRHCAANVGAELFAGNRDENGPVAGCRAEEETHKIIHVGTDAIRKEEEQHHQQGTHAYENHDHFSAATHELAQQAAHQVAEAEPEVGKHHGRAVGNRRFSGRIDQAQGGGKRVLRERHEHPDDKPNRQADHNAIQVFQQVGPTPKQHQEIAFLHLVGAFHVLEHARFEGSRTQKQQSESQQTAHDVHHLPVLEGVAGQFGEAARHGLSIAADQGCKNSSHCPECHDDHGAVAAFFLGHRLRNERDARAQFASETNTCNDANCRIDIDVQGEGIHDIRQGIKQNGAEQHGFPALFVAPYSPKQAPEEHAGHLHIKEVDAGFLELIGRPTHVFDGIDVFEALLFDDVEEYEVIDVDEVAERSHDDEHPLLPLRKPSPVFS